MSIATPPGSRPDFEIPFTLPEPPRPVDPMETPALGELTTPQLPGLETYVPPSRQPNPSPRNPDFPEVPGYDITDEIARGGMGVVYAAREWALGREVAIKTLLPTLAGHRHMTEQFDREARITARLPHPGVPPIHALGTLPDGRPYLVMKLIRGRTLAAILTARSQRKTTESTSDLDLTTPDAPGLIMAFEQICQAVAFAHSQGIVHRDLKPQNIMVGPFGEVQVMDWGLAREMKKDKGKRQSASENGFDSLDAVPSSDSASTQLGTPKGTPSYMPPEQARGDWDAVDARADVFALGGILCVLLTGSAPYTGPNVRVVIARATAGDLTEAFARLDASNASEDLIKLAKWCLSPDPAARPMNARAIAGLVELYRLDQEEQVRKLETERATAAGVEAVTWAAMRSTSLRIASIRRSDRVSEQLGRRFLSIVIAGVLIGLGVAYCWVNGVFCWP